MPCGQKGRVDQLCTSRTGPIAPAWIHSAICGVDSLPRRAEHVGGGAASRAPVWITSRASCRTLPSGLWMITCFPAFIAASATVACRWSGVMM